MAVEFKTDARLQKDILAELDWDPEVDATEIGVVVKNGVVTLTGMVDGYTKRWAAERAALRVAGVRAVANELVVKPPQERTDTDVARAAADTLAANLLVPHERIRVAVDDGWVTLEGEVDWAFQRREADAAIRPLAGVKGVTNLLLVRPPTAAAATLKDDIERALVRSAQVDAGRIEVHVADGRVRLSGAVRSWAERRAAKDAAWRAPGVTDVINEIQVAPGSSRQAR